MVGRFNEAEAEPVDRDERLGEAIEAYLALEEAGQAPEPSAFAAGYPDLQDDLLAALGGLALVQGLVGEPTGPGHRLESGRRVAGYRIVRELGRGGMGIVYEAVHVGLDRPVALKVLGSSAAPDSTGRRRFLNEARTAAGLHHTHIVPVFDVGQVGGLCYYAMQRIEGSGLDRVIKHLRRDRTVAAGSSSSGRRVPSIVEFDPDATGLLGDSTATWAGRGIHGPLRDQDDEPTPFEPPRGSAYYKWVAAVGRQAAEALAHAHQQGVIHRDVKPSNLLVDAKGVVWMADFGLARRLADPSQTQVDSLLGTPRYMSPEQAKIGPIDGRSDIYSLGATLYELITLRPPFEGRTAAELIEQIATRDPVMPHQIDPRVPRDLETIIIKALHKRAADRYDTASELADDLERYLTHEPVRARRIGPIGRAWRVARRHPSLTIVSTVATATVIASSTVAYVRVLHERDDARIARGEAQAAAIQLESAIREAHSALRAQLIQSAEVVRISSAADRRSTGLDLLKQAAALPSTPIERTRLRDEAVAYLAIRDVEKRPEIPLDDLPNALAFGPDGRHVAILSEDATVVQFLDVSTRTVIETRNLSNTPHRSEGSQRGRGGHRQGGNPFTRAGGRIVSTGDRVAVILPDGKAVRLFDVTTGALTGELRLLNVQPDLVGPPKPRSELGREIVTIAASADGRRLVSVDRPFDPNRIDFWNPRIDYRVHLWNLEKPDQPPASLYEPKPEPKTDFFARNGPPMIAISPDGSTVAVALFFDAEISIWTADGTQRDTIDSQAQLTALALGDEGLLAASGNRAVLLWDLDNLDKTRALLPALTPSVGFVDQLRFSPDDGTLLAVAGRGSVELWDVAATAKVATLPQVGDSHGLAIAPKSRLLALAQPSALALWAVVDPQALVQVAGFTQPLKSVAFTPDGGLVMADREGTLRFLGLGHCPTTADVVKTVRPASMTIDGSGRMIAVTSIRPDLMGPLARDRVDWFDLPDFKAIAGFTLPDLPRSQGIGRQGSPRFGLKIVRTPDDRTVAVLRGHEVFLFRTRADGLPGPPIPVEFPIINGPLRSGFSPDGRPDRGGAPRTSGWRDVAISPAGDRLYLLSLDSETLSARSLQGDHADHLSWTLPGVFSSMALSADGTMLAVGDREGTVLLLNPVNGRVIDRLGPRDGEAPAPVFAVVFSPNRSELAVGSVDEVRVWSLSNSASQPYVRLPGHHGPVFTLAFDGTGRMLASGGQDKTVKVWNLDRVRAELTKLGLADVYASTPAP